MLALAITNLALGYAAAMALVEPPLWSGWLRGWTRKRQPPVEGVVPVPRPVEAAAARESVATASELADAPAAAPVVAGLDELPADWLAQLAGEGIVAPTFVEAAAHPLRLE